MRRLLSVLRNLYWIVMFTFAIAMVVSGLLESDGQTPNPRHDNPRRPSPENFTPRAWDTETRDWLTAWPKSQRNELSDAVPVPAEGEIFGSDERRTSTGSGFSINGVGRWLTARHVVEGCDTLWLQVAPNKGLRVHRVVVHPEADVALLETKGGPAGLPLKPPTQKWFPDAYNVGFPNGAPGAVHSRYLGEMVMRHRGRMGFREKVNVWSERSRIPGRFGSLGGLSGGAVLDSAGRIVGVVEAESQRRGRIMTTQPEAIRKVIKLAQATARTDTAATAINADAYPTEARRLITTLRVVRVICRVEPAS